MSTNPSPFGGGGGQQPWQFTPEQFGGIGDRRTFSDATITGGALSTLTSASQAQFGPGDVGKIVRITGAGPTVNGSAGGGSFVTTISAFNSTTSVALASPATGAVANAFAAVGTDNTTAINTAITKGAAYATANRYFFELLFRAAGYMVNGALIQGGASKTNSQLPLPVVPITGNPTMVMKITGTRCNTGAIMFQGSGDTPAPGDEGTVLESTLLAQAYSGTFGQPALFGGPTSEQGFTGGNTNLWNNLMVVVDGITTMQQAAPTVSGIDLTSCIRCEIPWWRGTVALPQNQLANYNPWWVGGPFPKGLVTPQPGNNAHSFIGSAACQGYRTGFLLAEHASFQEIIAVLNGAGIIANGAGSSFHGITGLRYCAESNGDHIQVIGGNISINIVSMQAENANQFTGSGLSGVYFNDGSNAGYGRIGLQTSQGKANVTVNGAANQEIILELSTSQTGPNRGATTAPAVPAASTAFLNPFYRHAWVIVTGGTGVAISVDGTATGQASGAIRVPSGKTINLGAYTVAPTWNWWLD